MGRTSCLLESALRLRTPVTDERVAVPQNQMPEIGDLAPDIDAEITGGGRFTLSEYRGSWVAVYFYPRANTPG